MVSPIIRLESTLQDRVGSVARNENPADAIVLSCTNLSTDESLLTGESLPVRKIAAVGNVEMARPGGDELPFVYSGTLVVQGQGIVKVRSIGTQTEMGTKSDGCAAVIRLQPSRKPSVLRFGIAFTSAAP